MFADRLTRLMDASGINNKQLSEYSHLDSSSVSRLTKGSRVPSTNSITVKKIVNGLLLYADSKGKTDILRSVVESSEAGSAEEIKKDIMNWLYLDQPMATKSSRSSDSDNPKTNRNRSLRKRFGLRFNEAMELAGMSNIYLSRKAYVDPSLISRYRSGLRSPINNPDVAELLSSIIYRQIEVSGKISDLTRLMDIRSEAINETVFNNWLYAYDLHRDLDVSSTEKLLTAFESYSVPGAAARISPELFLQDETEDTKKDVYKGTSGLCDAVIRFLSSAVKNKPKELFLFSNQDMEWMTKDPAFFKRWALLMSACVTNGTRINIIHNIDRGFEEMNSAIIAWLPLYMSGMITPYYCTLPTGALFSHTIFLNPGNSCINANLIKGTEEQGFYYYYTNKAILESMADQFNKMLEHSKPLLRILPSSEAVMSDFFSAGEICIIQPSLSIMSMPQNTASSFGSPELMDKWNSCSALTRLLYNKRIFECITLCDPELISQGKAMVEAVPGAMDLKYTSDAYKEHINNIISLMNSNPGYRLVALPEAPFQNMQLVISDEQVRITRTAPPFFSFIFTHPQMCTAFKRYSEKLIKPYITDRRTQIKKLGDMYAN